MPGWGELTEKAECQAVRCKRPSVVRGYCQMHYKKFRAGRLSEEPMQVGDPDGFGHYGVVDETAEGLLCHECGTRVSGLGMHIYRNHDMTAREYKVLHGFPARKSLLPLKTQEQMAASARSRVGTKGWQNLVNSRDPGAAAAARTPESFIRLGATAVVAGAAAVANGKKVRKGIVRTCPICGASWCPLPPAGYKRRTCSSECWSALLSQKRINR